MSAGKVLLIDNDDRDVPAISQALSDAGLEVLHARDGSQGMQLIKTERPGLVILADDLPAISGYVVCKQIKQSQSLRETPVVLTSRSENAQQMFAQHSRYNTRADEYLIKPFERARLYSILIQHGIIAAPPAPPAPPPSLGGFSGLDAALGEVLSEEGLGDAFDAGDVEMIEMSAAEELEVFSATDGIEMMDSITDVGLIGDGGVEVIDADGLMSFDDELPLEDDVSEMFVDDVETSLVEMSPLESLEVSSPALGGEIPETLEIELDDDEEGSPFSALPSDESILDAITSDFDDAFAPSASFDPEMTRLAPSPNNNEVLVLREQVRVLKREAHAKAELESRLRQTEKERDALRDVETTHQQTISRLQEECDTLRDIEVTQQEAIERLRDEREDLQKRLDRIGQKMREERDSSARVAELEHEVHTLTVRLDFARDENEQMLDQVKSQRQEEVKALEARLERAQAGWRQTRTQLVELRAGLTRQLGALDEVLLQVSNQG